MNTECTPNNWNCKALEDEKLPLPAHQERMGIELSGT